MYSFSPSIMHISLLTFLSSFYSIFDRMSKSNLMRFVSNLFKC